MIFLLDKFFIIFHTVFTIFNAAGWAFRPLRKFHLFTMSITAFSWFVLGIFRGWGYCPLTDWHWQVREAMGRPIETYSYIDFLIREVTGIALDARIVDACVLGVFIVSFTLSIVLNIRDRRR